MTDCIKIVSIKFLRFLFKCIFGVFNVFYNFWYVNVIGRNNDNKLVYMGKSDAQYGSHHLYDYLYTVGNVEQSIKIVSNSKPEIDYKDINLSLKNTIVNCSLVSENNCIDITKYFREFVYHFDKVDDYSKMFYLFKHLESVLGKDVYMDMDIVVYLNDDNFKEYMYNIDDASKLHFCQVLI